MRPRLLLLLAGGLAGCGPAEAPNLVRLWAFGREGEVIAELARDFEARNPDLRVEVQQIPWTAAHEKLLTAHVGGSSPDVALLGNTWVPEFVTLDALEPLDGWIARSPEIRLDDYFGGILATNRVRDTLFGLPWYVDTRVLFYRTDLVRAAGGDGIPSTWAGWLDLMRAMKRRGTARQYPLLLPINEWPPVVILGLQAGSELISPDGYGRFADSGFRRGFEFYLDLFREGLAPPRSGTEIANLYQEFARGTIAMYITGPWNLGEFRRRLPADLQDDWATAPLPGPTGAASGVSLAGGASLVMFRRSARKDAAWRLITFLSAPAEQARFYRLTGDLPARREAWKDSALVADPMTRAFRIQLDRVVPTPMVPEWEQITTKLLVEAEAAVRGRRPAEDALEALDREVDRLLERRRYLLARRTGGDR